MRFIRQLSQIKYTMTTAVAIIRASSVRVTIHTITIQCVRFFNVFVFNHRIPLHLRT